MFLANTGNTGHPEYEEKKDSERYDKRSNKTEIIVHSFKHLLVILSLSLKMANVGNYGMVLTGSLNKNLNYKFTASDVTHGFYSRQAQCWKINSL